MELTEKEHNINQRSGENNYDIYVKLCLCTKIDHFNFDMISSLTIV